MDQQDSMAYKQLKKYAEDVKTLYLDLKEENKKLRETQQELEENYFETVLMGFDLINLYDDFLGGHCRRVAHYADMLGKRLELGSFDLTDLKIAALLHDIELIGTPKKKVLQWYSLDARKLPDAYRQHPEVNIRPIASSQRFQKVKAIIASHHEYIDGSGYPVGLQGKDIPLASMILTTVDHYDMLKHSFSAKDVERKVIHNMERDVRSKYDPVVFGHFKEIIIGKDDPYTDSLEVDYKDLKEGMILAESLVTAEGVKLLGMDTIINRNYLARLRPHFQSENLRSRVKVYAPKN